MRRRDFLKRSVQAAGGLWLASSGYRSARAATPVTTPHGSASLQPTAFTRLPTGSITPHGWLRHQLDLQLDGLNGRMPEVSDYLKYEGNGWVTRGSTVGWEEVPYWLRGFGDLGYVTGDSRVIGLATKWVNGILAAQAADGWFGPDNLRTSLSGGPDMWPHMPTLEALRAYHDYSGDARVLDFMTRYARFQSGVPGAQFNLSWAGVRWGDNIDSLHWLYDRTGDAALLELAAKIHANSADWAGGIASWHNVNIAQGFREGTQFWRQSHDPSHRLAAYRNYDEVMARYGQFSGGGFAGDENCRAGYSDPRQGFETCGIVEFMRSFELLTRLTGDSVWADRCEELAFNSLPAALDPLQKGCHYITSANSISLGNDAKGNDFDNPWPMQAYMPGVHNYRCCPHNYGMGWPYYAEEMWLRTGDGHGLCASLYGASTVRATVGKAGERAQIDQATHYPFGDTVQLTITALGRPTEFPLILRVPGWCEKAVVTVNGRPVEQQPTTAGGYETLKREWRCGDVVEMRLPMRAHFKRWTANRESVSVRRGPLAYSLAFDEQWKQSGGTARWPEYEVSSASPWNYGLVTAGDGALQVASRHGSMENPWTPATTPVTLKAKARRVPAWQADSHDVVGLLPESPASSDEPLETITLIPMGAARLRITSFPEIGGSGSQNG